MILSSLEVPEGDKHKDFLEENIPVAKAESS